MVRIILRRRLINLIVIFLATAFMVYNALHVKVSYQLARMLPASDTASIIYEDFKKQFGEDGSVMFIGIQDSNIYTLDEFNDWYDLSYVSPVTKKIIDK